VTYLAKVRTVQAEELAIARERLSKYASDAKNMRAQHRWCARSSDFKCICVVDIRRNYWKGNIFKHVFVIATASVVWWSEFLATDPVARVRFSALPEKKSSGSGTGSTQPREYK
jgi:hypothetical protein